jgi:CRISPR-associated protein Csb2
MSRFVLITARLHEGRYHGTGDWPPSPARLFQALVAGAGLRGPLTSQDSESLEWLERLSSRNPPVIASPPMRNGQTVKNFVPNNDLDTAGGDPRRIGEIRTEKMIRPRLFDSDIPFLYAWAFDDDDESNAQAICVIAEGLYQFGRGVDLAWAWGEVLDTERVEDLLSNYPGLVYRPSQGGGGWTLACPQPGSLRSLKDRYAACSQRFKTEGQGKASKQLFSQSPKPRFAQVAYESPPTRHVYELRKASDESSFAVWPLAKASNLVVALRDGAAERLRRALPDQNPEIERVLIGRKANGADDAPTSLRVRIVPLPSIGHHHADHEIRRALIEVPAGCPLRADDVHWAFSGLELQSPDTGEVLDLILTPSADETMLNHYGIGDLLFRAWRTVTPVALPESAARRRIDPARMAAEAKNGSERATEQARAAATVTQALRFAEILAYVETIRVQREPFESTGERVEAFAPGTRFAKERLWHVEIMFTEPITGPLLIGDGRFLGLGMMAPFQEP